MGYSVNAFCCKSVFSGSACQLIKENGSLRDKAVSLSLILLCEFYQVVPTAAVALFLTQIRTELAINYTQAGAIMATGMFVYALMQIPVGYLADRFRPKRIFFLACVGVAVVLLAFAVINKYWQAVTDFAFSGFFQSLLFAPGTVLMIRWFKPHQRAFAISLLTVGVFCGQIMVNTLGPVIGHEAGWRPVFLYFGAGGLLVAFAFLIFGKDARREHIPVRLNTGDFKRILNNRFMWFCNVMQYVRLACHYGIVAWIPSFLIVQKGLSLQATGLILTGQFVLMACGNMLGGLLTDRLRKPLAVIATSFVFVGITAVLFTAVDSIALVIVLVMVNSLFLSDTVGPLFSMPPEILGPESQGLTIGVGNFFGCLGSSSFTFILGSLKDTTGSFNAGFYTVAGVCGLGLIFAGLATVSRRSYLGLRAREVQSA
jgi:predicted MFS family arabinose efflux permease